MPSTPASADPPGRAVTPPRPEPPAPPLLDVCGLAVEIGGRRVVDGVSLRVPPGGTLAVVGESGSGKSMTALALMDVLPPGGRIAAGTVRFGGRDLAALAARERRAMGGAEMAMVFQDPLSALNPLWPVGFQIAEGLRLHRGMGRGQARRRAVELLARVRIPEPELRARQYPHQLSGGMRQRAMIAMAVAASPRLLVADEPTTALDPTVAADVLDLLDELGREAGMALLLITHDLGVAAERADQVAVMYAGRIVETGPAPAVLGRPRHPYTEALLRSRPGAAGASDHRPAPPAGGAAGITGRRRLAVIPGAPPGAGARPPGCAFHPRCPYVVERCRSERPDPAPSGPGRLSACWQRDELGRDEVGDGRS